MVRYRRRRDRRRTGLRSATTVLRELLADGAVVEYRYCSSNENARLATDGDTVALSGSDVPESTFPRRSSSAL